MSSAGLGTVLVRTDKDGGRREGRRGDGGRGTGGRAESLLPFGEFYQNFYIDLLSDLRISQSSRILSFPMPDFGS